MELKDNTNLVHTDDKFLWWAKLIADILLGVGVALFVILGIILSVNVGRIYLLYVFIGPVACFISWVFVRVFLSLCHDVKMIRNHMMSTKSDSGTPAPAPETVQTVSNDKIFCMECGAENIKEAKFCAKCGNKLSE